MSEVVVVTPDDIATPERQAWAAKINTAWNKTLAGILETAQLLLGAKGGPNKLSHGEWLPMIKQDLSFGPKTASRLMQIGRDTRIINGAYTHHLPRSWYTLYELTKLTDAQFEANIESKLIKSDMGQAAIRAENRKNKKAVDEQRVMSITPAPGKYRTLVIDPPWDYEWLSLAGRAAPGYATMTQDELKALDVSAWADDPFCHLYLWTTNNFMTRAVDLMAHWGFDHKTVLTWVKPRWGLGSYFRNSTEHVLFGERGHHSTRVDNIATHFEAPVGEHSEKPDIFYDIAERASFPPYGEVFQRRTREQWPNLYESAKVVT